MEGWSPSRIGSRRGKENAGPNSGGTGGDVLFDLFCLRGRADGRLYTSS